MGARTVRSVAATGVAGGLMLLSLAAAVSSKASEPTTATAARGWHSLLKMSGANLFTLAATKQNIWAGGYRVSSDLTSHSLLEHWVGGAWHAVALPASINPKNASIEQIAASSPSNVWLFILHSGHNLVARRPGCPVRQPDHDHRRRVWRPLDDEPVH